ncbi:hypothetical protein ACHAXM_007652 [Skeletonema potamos]
MDYMASARSSVWKGTAATLSTLEMPVVPYNGNVKNLMIKKATSNSSKKRKVDNSKNADGSLRAAIKNASLTLSRDTTLELVMQAGVSVLWPPATNRHLDVKDDTAPQLLVLSNERCNNE